MLQLAKQPENKSGTFSEQATADVTIFQGVPAIATYATLTFVNFQTTGVAAGKRCQ